MHLDCVKTANTFAKKNHWQPFASGGIGSNITAYAKPQGFHARQWNFYATNDQIHPLGKKSIRTDRLQKLLRDLSPKDRAWGTKNAVEQRHTNTKLAL